METKIVKGRSVTSPPGVQKKRHKFPKQNAYVKQSSPSVTTRLRPFGNSRGVILSNKILESAGIDKQDDIVVYANDGNIIISQVKQPQTLNTDLSTWDKHFKAAIKKGAIPDKDMFEGLQNDFDKSEW